MLKGRIQVGQKLGFADGRGGRGRIHLGWIGRGAAHQTNPSRLPLRLHFAPLPALPTAFTPPLAQRMAGLGGKMRGRHQSVLGHSQIHSADDAALACGAGVGWDGERRSMGGGEADPNPKLRKRRSCTHGACG